MKNRWLAESKWGGLLEIGALFLVAWVVIQGVSPLVGDNPLARQGVVWIANVLMLGTVWMGLRLRGQDFSHFGFHTKLADRRTVLKTIFQSIVVFAAAMTAFAIGAIIMANIVGIPEGADMSGYNHLQGNLPLTLISLLGILIVSSFGEEVIYRAFLIHRIAELGVGPEEKRWRLAVVLSAVIFGLIHYDWGISGVVQTGFMGLALGVAYLRLERRLWVTILAHAYLDSILVFQMYFANGTAPTQ